MILAKGFLLPAKGAVQWCRHFVRRRLSCRAVVVLLEIGYCFNLAINKLKSGYGKPQKKADSQLTANQPFLFFKVAGWTRLELATSCVTVRAILHNYQFIRKLCWKIVGCSSSKHMLFYLSINLANYLLIASKKSIFYSSFSVWFSTPVPQNCPSLIRRKFLPA